MLVPRGKLIGSGSFGKCYVDGDVLTKVGCIADTEFAAQQAAYKIGIAPQPYSYKRLCDRQSTMTMAYAAEYKVAAYGRMRNWEQVWLVMATIKYVQAGWSHGDLHEKNVLVCKGKPPLIIDYGMAYRASIDVVVIDSCEELLHRFRGKLNSELRRLARQYSNSLTDFANAVLLLTATTKLIKPDQREQLLDFWSR